MSRFIGIFSLFGIRSLKNVFQSSGPVSEELALFAWGRNSYGQLGLGNSGMVTTSSPTQVGTDTSWSFVSADPFGSTTALKNNGTLWAWGLNRTGQLGNGTTTDLSSPVQIGSDTTWSFVDGGYTVLALKTNGTLWGWGRNGNGQIGVSDTSNRSSPVQIGTSTDWAKISSNGSDIITIPFGVSMAIKNNGSLWSWGNNALGQLGQGNNTYLSSPVQVGTDTNWQAVGGNGAFTVALKNTGTIWSCGWNAYGQLGDGTTTNRNSFVQIGTGSTGDWVSIKAGTSLFIPGPHTVALKSNGTLWSWGRNTQGQLGLGNTTNRSSPVQIGVDTDWKYVFASSSQTLAIKSNGTLWGWGRNSYGEFLKGDTTGRSSPVQIGTSTSWRGATGQFSGDRHIIALLPATSGPTIPALTLFAWGNGAYGRLGGGNTTTRSSPVQIGTDNDWLTANAGHYSSLALKNNGSMWSWGKNIGGQLGLNDTTYRSSPVQVGGLTDWTFASTSRYHAFAIKSTGSLWAWGVNFNGRLGDSTTTFRSSPVQIGTDTDWFRAFGGDSHSIALKTNGTMWAWGANTQGVLGMGGGTRNSPVQIGSSTDWSSIAVGGYSNLAIKANGTLWGWGYDYYGKFGGSSATSIVSSPIQIGSSSDWVMASTSRSFGSTRWRSVGLAIKTNGTLWGWGGGHYGKLGTGNTTNRSSPVQIGADTDWSFVRCGEDHNIAIKTNGTVWTWGRNNLGQLGLNDSTNRSSPVQIGSLASWSNSEFRISAGKQHNIVLNES